MRNLFAPVLTAAVLLTGFGTSTSAQEPDPSDIPYSSVEQAIAALKEKKGVTFREQDGWTVAEDLDAFTVWLLTPRSHPAFPSIVRRTMVNDKDGSWMQTSVRCFASKEVCDKFFGGE